MGPPTVSAFSPREATAPFSTNRGSLILRAGEGPQVWDFSKPGLIDRGVPRNAISQFHLGGNTSKNALAPVYQEIHGTHAFSFSSRRMGGRGRQPSLAVLFPHMLGEFYQTSCPKMEYGPILPTGWFPLCTEPYDLVQLLGSSFGGTTRARTHDEHACLEIPCPACEY